MQLNVDIVAKEITTKAPVVGANTPGNVTRRRERGVKNGEEEDQNQNHQIRILEKESPHPGSF